MSVSGDLKVWNVFDFNCIFELKNERYEECGGFGDCGYLSASCFLFDNNQIYISQVFQCFVGEENSIKVLDLNGKIIKGFDKFYHDPEDCIYLLETYYDTNLSKIYIISGGRNKAKSYDFKENKIYRIYDGKPSKFSEFHNLVIKKMVIK